MQISKFKTIDDEVLYDVLIKGGSRWDFTLPIHRCELYVAAIIKYLQKVKHLKESLTSMEVLTLHSANVCVDKGDPYTLFPLFKKEFAEIANLLPKEFMVGEPEYMVIFHEYNKYLRKFSDDDKDTPLFVKPFALHMVLLDLEETIEELEESLVSQAEDLSAQVSVWTRTMRDNEVARLYKLTDPYKENAVALIHKADAFGDVESLLDAYVNKTLNTYKR